MMSSALAEQRSHDLHGMIRVLKKELVPFTQVVEARFAIGRLNEAILGALPVAGKEKIAFPANRRQSIPFILPEFSLPVRTYDFGHGRR